MSRRDGSISVNGKDTATVNKTRIRVRYAETDQMGFVYHAHHFIWFEVGRVELLRQLGFSYKDMEPEDDCFIVVVDARCRYKAPVHYDDEVIVRTSLKHVREKVIRFSYELQSVERDLLAEGETTHIVANSKMESRALPEKYLKVFRAAVSERTTNRERRPVNDKRSPAVTEN